MDNLIVENRVNIQANNLAHRSKNRDRRLKSRDGHGISKKIQGRKGTQGVLGKWGLARGSRGKIQNGES